MQSGSTDQTILGYLGRALSLELSAVQLYSTQSRLVANWGLQDAADKLRTEAREEMEHADRIIARMLAMGVAPNASQLRPVKLGPDLVSLLQIDQAFETELVKLYHGAVSYSSSRGYHDDRAFFQALLEEEQLHADELVVWINSLTQASGHSRR